MFKEFADEFYREVNRIRINHNAELEQKRREKTLIERKIRKLVDAIAGGADALSLNQELIALEKQQKEIEQELASRPDREPLVHPKLAELYRRKVNNLHLALSNPDTGTEAMEQIRELIDTITLTPSKGWLQVELRGDLAGILNLCSESKKPTFHVKDGLKQIKMVAGVGFVQAPTIQRYV